MILKPGSGFVAPALGKSGGSWEFQAILAYLVRSYLRKKKEIKMKSNEDEEITVPSKQNVLLSEDR